MWRSARPSPGWALASRNRSPLRRMKVTNCSYSSSDRASAMPGISPLTSVIRSSSASVAAWSTRARITGWFIQSVAWLVVMGPPRESGRSPWKQVSTLPGGGRRDESPPGKRKGGGPDGPPPSSSPPRPTGRLLHVGQPDALDPAGLGPRIEDPQADDAARPLRGQGLPQVGLGPHRLAFHGEDDVRPATLRIVEQDLPGRAARGDVGDDEPAGVGRDLELLGGVGRDRLDADAQAAHGGAGGRVGVVAVAVLVLGGHLRRVVERLQLDVERLAHAALAGHLDLDHVARPAEPDDLLELAHVFDRLAVHGHDDVARLDAGRLGR